jgi:hypothetical protein
MPSLMSSGSTFEGSEMDIGPGGNEEVGLLRHHVSARSIGSKVLELITCYKIHHAPKGQNVSDRPIGSLIVCSATSICIECGGQNLW